MKMFGKGYGKWMIALAACLLVSATCSRKSPETQKATPSATKKPAVVSQPASQPTTEPAADTQPAETQPTTRPTTRPASFYSPEPPYTTQLYVFEPGEKQPGWIEVTRLSNDKQMASAMSTFPRQNRIIIDTDNVNQLNIDIGFLPMNRGKRTILRIDGQNMELTATRDKNQITMQRSPIGKWEVIDSK